MKLLILELFLIYDNGNFIGFDLNLLFFFGNRTQQGIVSREKGMIQNIFLIFYIKNINFCFAKCTSS